MMSDGAMGVPGPVPSAGVATPAPVMRPGEAPPGETFAAVLYYSGLILFLPVVAFFVTKMVLLEAVLKYEEGAVASNVIAAGVAVVVLHVALGLFIYKAYFSGAPAKQRLGKQE